jgi:hypothetical protein
VQAARDARAVQRLGLAELGTQGHQARHLGLGNGDLFAAPLGEAHILDFVIAEGGCHSGLLEGVLKRVPRSSSQDPLGQGMQTHAYIEIIGKFHKTRKENGVQAATGAPPALSARPVHWLQVSIGL